MQISSHTEKYVYCENFIGINENLQSINDENIFAAGDVASIQDYQRPKSGVMAVRQGQILKENIFLKIQGKKLKKFRPWRGWKAGFPAR